jgi:DNA polymerase-3 subunit alpha
MKNRQAPSRICSISRLCRRRIVSRRVIEALIRASAFDAIGDHRARQLASVGIALEAASNSSAHSR